MENSKELNCILKIYMIIIWFRFIYIKLDKYNKKPVKNIIEKDIYYIEYSEKDKIIIDRDEYVNDIVTYLYKIKKYSIKTFDFLIKNMDYFVNNFIPKYNEELNNKKECNNCPICFEEINIENKIICTYCKNTFHETCINSAWKKNIDNCPMCRELIVKHFFYYSNMRKELIKDIYNIYNKNNKNENKNE
jgi:hypothetical protein